jgi:hypothetical protein
MKCAVKRGIVVLRDCGERADDTCVECKRSICQEHTRFLSGETLCVECHARKSEESTQEKAANGKKKAMAQNEYDDTWDDHAWPYYYRHHYYTNYGYSPFYHGHYYDSYYDDYDVRAFDEEMTDINDVDEEAGGFYDS